VKQFPTRSAFTQNLSPPPPPLPVSWWYPETETEKFNPNIDTNDANLKFISCGGLTYLTILPPFECLSLTTQWETNYKATESTETASNLQKVGKSLLGTTNLYSLIPAWDCNELGVLSLWETSVRPFMHLLIHFLVYIEASCCGIFKIKNIFINTVHTTKYKKVLNVKTQCHILLDDDMFRNRRPSSGLKNN
jgi:hypothetical protein